MKCVRLVISGDVVGVGYRAWVSRQAKDLELAGWVKNREDDSVELVAEGQQEALVRLITACKKGPDVAWVKRVDVTWQRAGGEFADFEVVY